MISLQPEQPSLAREDSVPAPQASKKVDRGSRLEGSPFTKKRIPFLSPKASKKERWVFDLQRAPGAGVEDFVPWVASISSRPLASEEGEEEDGMADLVHNFGA